MLIWRAQQWPNSSVAECWRGLLAARMRKVEGGRSVFSRAGEMWSANTLLGVNHFGERRADEAFFHGRFGLVSERLSRQKSRFTPMAGLRNDSQTAMPKKTPIIVLIPGNRRQISIMKQDFDTFLDAPPKRLERGTG